MSLDTRHPDYLKFQEDWDMLNDTFGGDRTVKDKTTIYLSATSGMIMDGFPTPGTPGTNAYNAYIKRAIFHAFISEAVNTLVGIMHHKPPTIELPSAMEPMRENGTVNNESLEMLLRRINKNQLLPGRYGLLLDLPSTPTIENVLPYIAAYKAKTIINWDDGGHGDPTVQNLNLVVLDETESERQSDFTWEEIPKFRVLALGDLLENEGQNAAVYRMAQFRDTTTFDESSMIEPAFRGRALNEIPFIFVNPLDILPAPDNSPLLGLAILSLAIYRGEADYRQSLFMQSQDTLVTIGDAPNSDGTPKTYRTGANASIAISNPSGDAKFIGVESQGLTEQREALTNDKKDAASLAGQLMDTSARSAESGEALQMRVAARTATLNSIALTGAFALQSILRIAAKWIGANPDEVIVTPNLDFADEKLEGRTIVDFMQAKMLGAPYSLESIHKVLQDRGLTDFSFEEEMAKIADEILMNTASSESSSPAGDESDDEDIESDGEDMDADDDI